MPVVYKKMELEETEEELMALSRDDVTYDLTDRERKFCEYYVRSFNNKIAAAKAGYTGKNVATFGWKIRQKYAANRYIAWLKLRVCKDCHIDAVDLIDQYIRIAFADITDFISIKNGRAKIEDAEMLDGQLIKSIKQTPNGVQVELYDKMSALDKLERFLDFMPKDWRQRVEERKLELMAEKIEIERAKTGYMQQDDTDDGFIDALKETATQVWNDELEEE